MTISVHIIKDSVSPEGIRLTTFQLRYPRIIHAELMTHRVFSRNGSSSRAIPVMTILRNTVADPAAPVHWGSNKPGMQAGEELTGWRLWLTKAGWYGAMYGAVAGAWLAYKAGAHKQVVNRILEPWSHISVVLTSTCFRNWFALRDHADADPTIRALARAMQDEYLLSTPQLLQPGEWHLPYVDDTTDHETLRKISAARCARVSYLNHDKSLPSLEQDLTLFDRLMGGELKHSSPTEHQATPDKRWSRGRWAKPEQHGNFRGWVQYRKTIPGEAVHEH